MIYLDNAATTRLDPAVRQVMSEWENYANAGSIYAVGREARARVEQARAQVAQFLNCNEDQVIFTSGGSESNATVMRGFDIGDFATTIAYSAVEHESVRDNAEYACRLRRARRPHQIPVYLDTGVTSANLVEQILKKDKTTGIVSVMGANNEVSSVNDIYKIGELCDEYGVLFHTDCVQAVGTVPLDVQKVKCDFLSMSAHKFHGPKGVGVLFCRDKSYLHPLIVGSAQQEFGMRAGTENVTGIIGLGAAIQAISDDFEAIKYEIKL